MPSHIAPPRVTKPRMRGHFRIGWRSVSRGSVLSSVTISPDGLRTATQKLWGDRIITPSITACPPIKVVSSPLSKTGSSCICANRRTNARSCKEGGLPNKYISGEEIGKGALGSSCYFGDLARDDEFLADLDLIRALQLVAIRFEDPVILVGVAVDIFGDLRKCVARFHRVRLVGS